MQPKIKIHVVGAGLAGSDAAWTLAEAGCDVHLYEMRPLKMTEAHHTDQAAELVCSNTFKSKAPGSAPAILKEEMRALGSLVLKTGEECHVPGGDALTVDRERFSKQVTEKLKTHPNITWHNSEVEKPFDGEITILATGPLTSEKLTTWVQSATGTEDLYFYDAIAPIVDASSIDPDHSFLANRYGKGGEDAYINCPMNKAEYELFIDTLMAAEKTPGKAFEKEKFFQGCQPIEAIASTGRDTLRYGPMKPVGLVNPKTGERPYACVQLRAENLSKTAYNIVGFQTRLKYGEQKRVFSLIPALKNAEFIRLGSIHRNTYVIGPSVLRPDLSLKGHPNVYLAGQITGVEGYLESASSGLLCAQMILQRLRGKTLTPPPPNTALGALLRHVIASEPKNYQPANINFSLLEPSYFTGVEGLKKDALKLKISELAVQNFIHWKKQSSGVHASGA